jgi:RHS repeat-associated protein
MSGSPSEGHGSYTQSGQHDIGNVLAKGTPTHENSTVTQVPSNASSIVSHTYDANGNRSTDPTYAYTYDAENRPTQLNIGSMVVLQNTYDGDGNWIVRIASDTTTPHYVGDWYEYDPTASVAATDTSGTRVASARYWPFGGLRSSTGTLPTDRLFTGQIRDLVNDAIYFFKARYYDATIGKFHTAEGVVPRAGNPQALNRYAYGLNNPLRLNDPTGHVYDDPNDGTYKQNPQSITPDPAPTPDPAWAPSATPTSLQTQSPVQASSISGPGLLPSIVHSVPTNISLLPGNGVNDAIGLTLGAISGGTHSVNAEGNDVFENVHGVTGFLVRDVLGHGDTNAMTMGHVILNSGKFSNDPVGREWMAHENMHTHQSALLGMFYLPVYAAQALGTMAVMRITAPHASAREIHDAMPMEAQANDAGFINSRLP